MLRRRHVKGNKSSSPSIHRQPRYYLLPLAFARCGRCLTQTTTATHNTTATFFGSVDGWLPTHLRICLPAGLICLVVCLFDCTTCLLCLPCLPVFLPASQSSESVNSLSVSHGETWCCHVIRSPPSIEGHRNLSALLPVADFNGRPSRLIPVAGVHEALTTMTN